jgi:hypothetical protein
MKSILVALSLSGAAVVAGHTWTVGQGDVRVICPMTIGGSFEAKSTALSGSLTAGDSGSRALAGSLAVDRGWFSRESPPRHVGAAPHRHRSNDLACRNDPTAYADPIVSRNGERAVADC